MQEHNYSAPVAALFSLARFARAAPFFVRAQAGAAHESPQRRISAGVPHNAELTKPGECRY